MRWPPTAAQRWTSSRARITATQVGGREAGGWVGHQGRDSRGSSLNVQIARRQQVSMYSLSTVLLAIVALRCPAGFMTRQWYPPETAEALRKELLAAAQPEMVIAAARQTMVQVRRAS
jgi:hypothetical protein